MTFWIEGDAPAYLMSDQFGVMAIYDCAATAQAILDNMGEGQS